MTTEPTEHTVVAFTRALIAGDLTGAGALIGDVCEPTPDQSCDSGKLLFVMAGFYLAESVKTLGSIDAVDASLAAWQERNVG